VEAEAEFTRLTEFAAGEVEEKHIKEVIQGVVADMESWHYARGSQQIRGLPTGPPGVYLDKVLMGIRETHYVTVAGRPGDGKSSLAMNVVEFLAKDYVWYKPTGHRVLNAEGIEVDEVVETRGIPVAVFSIEMDNESLGYRLMFGRAGVDEAQWNQGFAHKGDMEKLQKAGLELAGTNIYLDDTPAQSIGRIAAKARRMVKQYGIKLFVLDYLQLCTSDNPRDDERTRLDKISKKIFALKKQLKVPWLVLAQMNRNIETSERDRAPVLSDLAGSGSIEQDSDKVIILKKPSRRDLEKPKQLANNQGEGPSEQQILDRVASEQQWAWSARPSRVDAWVVKNRRGPRGKAEMIFQNNLCRFEDFHMWKIKYGVEERKEGESKWLATTGDLPSNEELLQ
jgi:replicative DNA helicase